MRDAPFASVAGEIPIKSFSKDTEAIAEITGLPIEELQRLKQENGLIKE